MKGGVVLVDGDVSPAGRHRWWVQMERYWAVPGAEEPRGGTTAPQATRGCAFPFMPACTLPGPLLWTQFSTRITHGLHQIFEGHTAKDIRGMIKSCPFPGTQHEGNYCAKPWTADKAWVWLKRLLIAANANNHHPADYTVFECLWISECAGKRHNGVNFHLRLEYHVQ